MRPFMAVQYRHFSFNDKKKGKYDYLPFFLVYSNGYRCMPGNAQAFS